MNLSRDQHFNIVPQVVCCEWCLMVNGRSCFAQIRESNITLRKLHLKSRSIFDKTCTRKIIFEKLHSKIWRWHQCIEGIQNKFEWISWHPPTPNLVLNRSPQTCACSLANFCKAQLLCWYISKFEISIFTLEQSTCLPDYLLGLGSCFSLSFHHVFTIVQLVVLPIACCVWRFN